MPRLIKTILVTGSQGQLGRSLKTISAQYSTYHFTFANRDEIDFSRTKSITNYFQKNQFDLIINCAAYTSVDKAEKEQGLADLINHIAVKNLAYCAQYYNTILIHISTDYVYDGTAYKPYLESNSTNPQNIYGISKLRGEQAIQAIAPHAIIIRTSWVYSEFRNNFVKTMLKLGQQRDRLNIVFDQIGSPTYAKDLAHCILQLIPLAQSQNKVTVYHFSNEGICSWYDFAKAIFELTDIQCFVRSIESKDYPTPAKRPHYCVLNTAKIKQECHLIIPYWKDSLQGCIKILQENKLI